MSPSEGETSAGTTLVLIEDDDFLIRKIPAVPHMQNADGGRRRISKSAFSASSPAVDPEEGMSTNSKALLESEGVDVAAYAPEFAALALLKVSDLRGLGLTVEHRPMPHDYSHCQVLGVQDKHRKKILRISAPLRKPDDEDWPSASEAGPA